MGFESASHSNEEEITPERLLDACQKFADVLSNGKWTADTAYREVKISRKTIEVVGRLPKNDTEEDESLFPANEIQLSTKVTFHGEKNVITDDGIDVGLEERFQVKAVAVEVIPHEELPEYVLRKLAKNVRVVDDNDDESNLAGDARYGLTPMMLGNFMFEREYEVRYSIDKKGEIDDYYCVIRYKADRGHIAKFDYSWEKSILDLNLVPARIDEEKNVIEWQFGGAPPFEESDIADFQTYFEKIMVDALERGQFEELEEDLYLEEGEHLSRPLGIIAMTAVGFKGIKI